MFSIRSVLSVGFMTLISRVLGFVREMLVAQWFENCEHGECVLHASPNCALVLEVTQPGGTAWYASQNSSSCGFVRIETETA